MQTCTSTERERAQRERNDRERAHTKCRLPVAVCSLIIKLAQALTLALFLCGLSLFVALSVLFASSRQIMLASSLIRLNQSAFKRDGVHLVEPIGAVYNSRVCVYVCVCECQVIFAIQIDND